jgi:CheY-like chemotaxis protein
MGKRTLIVEDNFELADNAKSLLETDGFEVCGILDSHELIEKVIEEKAPSAVLLDIHLNGEMDGIEIATLIRRNFDIPVVFLPHFQIKRP